MELNCWARRFCSCTKSASVQKQIGKQSCTTGTHWYADCLLENPPSELHKYVVDRKGDSLIPNHYDIGEQKINYCFCLLQDGTQDDLQLLILTIIAAVLAKQKTANHLRCDFLCQTNQQTNYFNVIIIIIIRYIPLISAQLLCYGILA